MFLYFAYGSNMLTERLVARCPSARAIGPVRAEGHRFSFDKQGHGTSGKATLLPAPDSEVPGVLFEIAIAERVRLDEAEGPGYERLEEFAVTDLAGRRHLAVTYLARAEYLREGLRPCDWYKALVLAGIREHGIDRAHLERVEAIEAIADPDPDHSRRREAMRALGVSGFVDLVSETA